MNYDDIAEATVDTSPPQHMPEPAREDRNLEILHLYGQSFWHDDAYIVGTARDLIALRDAIDKALVESHATIESFTADGEGYRLTVIAADDDTASRLSMPYTDEVARDNRVRAVQPYQLHQSMVLDSTGAEPEDPPETGEVVSTEEPPPRDDVLPASTEERLRAEDDFARTEEEILARQREANAAWVAAWPNHCPHCSGWGHRAASQNHVYGSTTATESFTEPCQAIEDARTCHRCAAPGLDENGEGPCTACRWNYDDGLPGMDA
jgi:hypothetical protein